MNEKITGLHVRINARTHRTAKAKAAEKGLTLGNFVELAILHYIEADSVAESCDMVVDNFAGE